MTLIVNRVIDEENLLRRPRVSYRLSEYVLEFINIEVLKPSQILQSDKYTFQFDLAFGFGISGGHFPYESPYATEKRRFMPYKGFRAYGSNTKFALLMVVADDVNEKMNPNEYAYLVFDMFADYFLYNFKKLQKPLFDEAKLKLNLSKINSFQFPAKFEEQRYILDDSTIEIHFDENGKKLPTPKLIVIKDEYLKRYEH